MAYLDTHGLETLWTRMKALFGRKLGNTTGDDSVTIKLQNAAGNDLTDGTTVISAATTTAAGVMSKADKSKLDGIEAQANKYVHPTTSGNKHIPSGGSSGKILGWSADGTAAWVSAHDTGVTKIVAGSNVTVSPAGGTGEVTVNATDTKYTAGTNVTISGTTISATDTTYIFNTAYNASSNKAATMADVNNAVVGNAKYCGTLANEAAFTALANYKQGNYWVASASWSSASKGITIDSGNMIFANADGSTFSAAKFDVIQADIEAIPDSDINALS